MSFIFKIKKLPGFLNFFDFLPNAVGMTDIVSQDFNPGNTENSTASIRWNKFHPYNVVRAYGTLKWELPQCRRHDRHCIPGF
jgi:hypothetical protein